MSKVVMREKPKNVFRSDVGEHELPIDAAKVLASVAWKTTEIDGCPCCGSGRHTVQEMDTSDPLTAEFKRYESACLEAALAQWNKGADADDVVLPSYADWRASSLIGDAQ